MEYFHRTLGRTIGAVYFVPAAYFWYKNWFTKAMKKRVVLFGALLGFQVNYSFSRKDLLKSLITFPGPSWLVYGKKWPRREIRCSTRTTS